MCRFGTVIPAVKDDGDGSDFAKYEESHYDLKHLAFHEGQEPTWFHVKQLTQRQRSHIAEMSLHNRCLWAFRFGVTAVENYFIDGAGECTAAPPVATAKQGDLGQAVTQEWLSKADPATDVIMAVGVMILHLSEASTPLSGRSRELSGPGS